MFDHRHYVPILRWKKAEQLALRDLGRKEKAAMTPLIEVTPRASGLKSILDPARVDQRCSKVVTEILEHWGDDTLFLDLGLVDPENRTSDGVHPLIAFFRGRLFSSFIPVTTLDRDAAYQAAMKSVVAQDRLGLCLRLHSSELEQPNFPSKLALLLKEFDLECEEVDILVDYGSISGVWPSFARACERLPNLSRWRTFTIVSGAFPKDLSDMAIGEHELPRQDWQAWRDQVTAHPPLPRLPAYGDYGLGHPIFKEPGSGLNPSASIRYTAEDYWVIMRGEGILNDSGPSLSQFPAIATLLCGRSEFRGKNFSSGDRYIQEMAKEIEKNGSGRTGNLKTWLQATINQHLTLTTNQIANLSDSSAGDAP